MSSGMPKLGYSGSLAEQTGRAFQANGQSPFGQRAIRPSAPPTAADMAYMDDFISRKNQSPFLPGGGSGQQHSGPYSAYGPGQAQPVPPPGMGTPYEAYRTPAPANRPPSAPLAYDSNRGFLPGESTEAQQLRNRVVQYEQQMRDYIRSLPANQQRALQNSPDAKQMLAELAEWRKGAAGPLAPANAPGSLPPAQNAVRGFPDSPGAGGGARQLTPDQRQYERHMQETWSYVRSLPEDQQRALQNSPSAAQMLEDLRRWRAGGTQSAPQQPPAQPPSPQAGGQFQDLFQQFNFQPPAGFMDALIQRLQGAPGGSQASRQPSVPPPPSAPQMPPMPSPPPGFDQFGTPQAQRQMFDQSQMAWTMPKQQLLGWGQQAVQQPWAPNYGNMPANFRPMPYEISYNNPFGTGPMDISQNRDAFIGSILNNQANRFVGTQVGDGPVSRPPYDPSQLWSQAQSMLSGGWQNPFAMR